MHLKKLEKVTTTKELPLIAAEASTGEIFMLNDIKAPDATGNIKIL